MWPEKEALRSWRYRESYSEWNRPFFTFFKQISKPRCKFDSGLFQPILGLKMSPVMIWIVLGCCWVSQIRTKPTKNIWGPLLDSISSYYVQCPWKIVSFFQVFRHLNYHILVYFPAYIGLYWTPAGWYGQKPYLGPAHMWLRQNMAVCDAELGPKWGGVTNTRFTFLASYGHLYGF